MKYTVGVQFINDGFTDCILENADKINEVYFSWGDFPNARNNQIVSEGYLQCEMYDKQREVLKKLSDNNIALNLLLNGNCYGKYSLERAFFEKIGNTVDYIRGNYGLNSVTTTSPVIAKFLKSNFSNIYVRASVNMEIGTIEGMDYISEYFDGFYMKREYNRDFDKIKELRDWCDKKGKTLHILANSGCLNNCSIHTFHDNIVSHENEIMKMDNCYEFQCICDEYLKNHEKRVVLVKNTNFIRPEDVHYYEEYFDSMKLATRVSDKAILILKSYIKGKYIGNILELLEPNHAGRIYPYLIENSKLNNSYLFCNKKCLTCDKCAENYKKALVELIAFEE